LIADRQFPPLLEKPLERGLVDIHASGAFGIANVLELARINRAKMSGWRPFSLATRYAFEVPYSFLCPVRSFLGRAINLIYQVNERRTSAGTVEGT
jgi:hypothetical protein